MKARIPAVTGGGSCFIASCTRGGPGVSNASSTGSHRQPGGQDVLRGMHVPVMPGATRRTDPRSDPHIQLSKLVGAHRTHLRAWVPAVDSHGLAAVATRFVFEHEAESGPTRARNCTSQRAIMHHSNDVEIPDCNHVVLADQADADLVQEIPASIAGPGVHTGYPACRLDSVGRSRLAAGEPLLVALQPALMLLPILGVRDLHSCGQGTARRMR